MPLATTLTEALENSPEAKAFLEEQAQRLGKEVEDLAPETVKDAIARFSSGPGNTVRTGAGQDVAGRGFKMQGERKALPPAAGKGEPETIDAEWQDKSNPGNLPAVREGKSGPPARVEGRDYRTAMEMPDRPFTTPETTENLSRAAAPAGVGAPPPSPRAPGTASLEGGEGYKAADAAGKPGSLRNKVAAGAAAVGGTALGATATPTSSEEASGATSPADSGEPLPADQVPYAPGKGPAAPASGPSESAPAKPATVADVTKQAAKQPAQAAPEQGAKSAADAPTPDDATRRLQALADRAGDSTEYKKELGKLDTLAQAYRQAFQETQDRIAKQELAEKMGHALAQLGAGMQGQKTGLDTTTGLKFDKTDWSARYKNALDELKANLDDLREQRGAATTAEREKQQQAGEATRELGRESTQREDTKTREEGENKRNAATNAAHIEAAKVGAASKETVANIHGDTARDVTAMKGANALKNTAAKAAQKSGAAKDDPGQIALNNLVAAAKTIEDGDAKGAGTKAWNANYGRAKTYLQRTGGDPSQLDLALQQSREASGLFSSTAAGTGAKTLAGAAGKGAAPSKPAGNTAAGKHQPGDLVTVGGKTYRVGADGDTLEPAQ